ncbi:peptide chain release factor N(5)-glutamine methyltransferase [Alkalicaulis satelles]|uniref:Release factor glutamine methyltransferase n=1 Tax=Alkalicaulis satelles TaxID=2609175 RepID=A0A5M6ZG36_9PROT|nr:peptide chain release factor N(5)-glutamine methyltransferase [Alkalicaulis satelles]KAA5803722.1 peptide chain release factor N(5)-glutamine methyltransferase [Alkalicaulis satelles]
MSAPSWRDLLREGAAALRAAGLGEDAQSDARRLLEAASGLGPAALMARKSEAVEPALADAFAALITRRAAREPLSHIVGSVGFWTLDLIVTRDVLTPRPDTETVVEAALAAVPDRSAPLEILDIATGSGAIALALLSELPSARAVATDISAAALAVARNNAAHNRLSERITFIETSWADGVDGPFDLVVSNPPYIASAVIDTLEPEVRDHEPRLALDGGPDGLAPYPHLLAEARRLLKPGGSGVFEIGYDQGEAALALASAAGAAKAQLRRDLAGRGRALVFGFEGAQGTPQD